MLKFLKNNNFFFSSRRRHTRCSRDWSSDVCSSDLRRCAAGARRNRRICQRFTNLCLSQTAIVIAWFRSEERRVGKSVDLGGRRIIKKKKKKKKRKRQLVNKKRNILV